MTARSAEIDESAPVRVAALIDLLCLQVGVLDDILTRENASRAGARREFHRIVPSVLGIGRRHPVIRCVVKAATIEGVHHAERRTT